MDLLNKEILWALMDGVAGSCSIYLPTHRVGAEIQQDPIRLKNLLRVAEEKLVAGGMRGSDARVTLEPAYALLEDKIFWQHQGDGLALFVAPGAFHYYRLPVEFKELVVVTDRFHIKPLIPLFAGDGRFYILALSLNQVRLLQATRHNFGEIDMGELSMPLEEALGYDNIERRRQLHTGRGGGRGRQAGIFHGHGDEGLDDAKDNILRHFRRIDRGLSELLPDETTPLVLAGVDYLLPIYREASDYGAVLDEGIEGNPDRSSPRQLHKAAWKIVRRVFAKSQEKAEARFHERAGTGLASNSLNEIVPAAQHGRVESLFVALGIQRWGTYDADTSSVEEHGDAEPGDRDLLDLAAAGTLMKGGEVFAVAADKVPSHGERAAAAVFRY